MRPSWAKSAEIVGGLTRHEEKALSQRLPILCFDVGFSVRCCQNCVNCGLALLSLLRYYPPNLGDEDQAEHHNCNSTIMQRVEVNYPPEHGLCLRLFVTNSGGV
jgi:hypothetical protein